MTESLRGGDGAPGPRDPAVERAFDRLWREYYRRLWAFVRSSSAVSSEEAEDAVQEIMMKIYRAMPGLDRTRPSAPWVFRIARAYRVAFDRQQANQAELGRAAAYFEGLGRYLACGGAIGVMIGIVAILGAVKDVESAGKGFAVCLLSALYAVTLFALVVVPCRTAVRKRLAGPEA